MSKIHKVLTLPAVLEVDGIYLEKKPTGVALHVADNLGVAAYTLARKVMLLGPTSLFYTEVGSYTIRDYTDRVNYTVSSSDGVVTRNGSTITFTVNNTSLAQASFVVNGRTFTVTMKPIQVVQPSIVSPVNNATNVPVTGTTVYSTPFALNYAGASDTQVSADWEVATDPNFATIVASSYNDTTNKTSWPIPAS